MGETMNLQPVMETTSEGKEIRSQMHLPHSLGLQPPSPRRAEPLPDLHIR